MCFTFINYFTPLGKKTTIQMINLYLRHTRTLLITLRLHLSLLFVVLMWSGPFPLFFFCSFTILVKYRSIIIGQSCTLYMCCFCCVFSCFVHVNCGPVHDECDCRTCVDYHSSLIIRKEKLGFMDRFSIGILNLFSIFNGF